MAPSWLWGVLRGVGIAVGGAAGGYLVMAATCVCCFRRVRNVPWLFRAYLAAVFWPMAACRRRLLVPLWRCRHRREVLRLPSRGSFQAPSVRAVVVSDTHGFLSDVEVPPGDVLLHCGDILLEDRGGAEAQLAAFNRELGRLPHRWKVVIGGNHDATLEQIGRDRVQEILSNAVYLEDQGVLLPNGLSVYGSPVSLGHSDNAAFQPLDSATLEHRVMDGIGAFMRGEKDAVHGASTTGRDGSAMPSSPDVVLLHGPPRRALKARLVATTAAQLVAFGHLHGGYGRVDEWETSGGDGKRGTTVFINAASMDGMYAATHAPCIMDLAISRAAPVGVDAAVA